jgi:hypothetical protein
MVTANRADCPKASLMIAFPKLFHLGGPVGEVPARPVLPSDVAAGIRAAIVEGWIAERPGKQFVHRVTEEDV